MKFSLSFSLLALASLGVQRLLCSSGTMAANELVNGIDPGFDKAKQGDVYAANEGELTSAWKAGNEFDAANDGNLSATPLGLSRPLTEYTAGVQDKENLQELLNRIAPPTPRGGIRFTYTVETEAEEFQKRTLPQITRPVHGEFPVLKITGSEAEGRCANLGLTSYIDIDQGGMNAIIQQAEVQRLKNIILRSQIADALSLIDGAAVEDTTKNWGDAAANPDGNVREMVKNSGGVSGEDANVVVFGHGAWHKRLDCYEVPTRTNGGERSGWSPDRLAQYLQVDDVVNVKARYRSSATALTDMLGSTVYAYSARAGLSASDSSNVKRFEYVSEQGGMRVWIQIQSHRVKITVDAYAVTKITRSVGIRKRVITYT